MVVGEASAEHPHLEWTGRAPLTPGGVTGIAARALYPLEVHAAARPPLLPPTSAGAGGGGRLCLGDNLAVGGALLPELNGKVDLIYIDPPFGTGGRFRVRRQPGEAGTAAYGDAWQGGLRGYLNMLQPRLELAHALLAAHGSLYVHLDPTAAHYVKVMLDQIFGPECFQREIIWRIGWVSGYKGMVQNWVRNHDTILFYTRDPERFTFHKSYVPHLPGYSRRGGGEGQGHPVDDVWNGSPAEHALTGADALDSIQIKSFSAEKTGYETQKNESLLRRVIEASSNPGDLVVDLFAGSGTTLAVAENLGRRWLGCDCGMAAVHVTRKRLLALRERAAFTVHGTAPVTVVAAESLLTLAIEGSAARARLRQPDGVDYWAVQWQAGEAADAPLQPDFVSYRTYGKGGANTLVEEALHRYPRPGTYTVTVHIADGEGVLRRCRSTVEAS